MAQSPQTPPQSKPASDSTSNADGGSPSSSSSSRTTASPSSSSSAGLDIRSLTKKPGELIRAEDWNRLVDELAVLRLYINNMSESVNLTSLQSDVGEELELDAGSPARGSRAVGLITRQWVSSSRTAPSAICAFGITDYFEVAQFWACADNGDKKTLDVILEYDRREREPYKAGDALYINDSVKLGVKDPAHVNPWLDFIMAPSGTWYKYQIRNKFPKSQVKFIRFVNTNNECRPRIGNVLHLRSRIMPMP